MGSSQQPSAYCTLLTNDGYVPAALVLAKSLRNTDTTLPLVVLVVPGTVSDESRKKLQVLYDDIIEVPAISGISNNNLMTIGRPDLHLTLTKLNLWSLAQYERVLYLDADTLVIANLDHLFSLPKSIEFAASPELGFPDCFNSGMMLLVPNDKRFAELKQLATEIESFDGGDQGLLNVYFGDGTLGQPPTADSQPHPWYRLSFTYNMEMHQVYRMYIPAVLRYRAQHKVLHFIGKDKPWHFVDGKVDRPKDAPGYFHFYADMVEKWWAVRREVDAMELLT
ncbi:family 8 glycosyl transferase [Thelonectria olida]|uniref:glycogenin glucosyltransferase n=1 Tax=Thelonectria olida TaxID=1576542 RepID=A0A9P9AVG6_9HYPO|nr:family 8 glycosyl transferase [Thelonectria olida]